MLLITDGSGQYNLSAESNQNVSSSGKVWSPKIKNVEPKILTHLSFHCFTMLIGIS